MNNPSVFTRIIRSCLLFLAVGVAGAAAADLRLIRVAPGWRDAASFKRISEYFDGRENTGGQLVRRTQPAERGGYYFLVRTANRGAPVAGQIAVHVFLPGAEKPRTFTFPVTIPTRETVFNLGLTGPDWPGAKIHAVAWKIDVLDAGGTLLATEKSYLWDKSGSS